MSKAYSSSTSKTRSNLFENFYNSASEDEGSPSSNPQRKARKKLREIDALERKPIKTLEEFKKIDEKEYYQAIACPPEIPLESYQDKLSTKQKKEFKRNEHQLKKKIATYVEELREKKDAIRTLEREKKDAIRTLEREKKDAIRTLEEENAHLRNGIATLGYKLSIATSSCAVGSVIRKEYEELCATKVRKKAWRDIMLKYHCDKTKKVLGFEVSNAIAKIATDLKPEC
jgi:DNA repair exonuclease SbcCD ATPase subunit